MVSKTQINNYNGFLDNIYDNIYKKVFDEKELNISKIQEIINDKENIIDPVKYNEFLNTAYESNFLSYDKNILKNYINSYLEKYITTLTKNIIIKYYTNLVEHDKITYKGLISIFLFLNIFFRYKGNNNIFDTIKEKILTWYKDKKLTEDIVNLLKEYAKKTNFQNNSIFRNQLIKFLKQKNNKELKNEAKTMSNGYEEDLISFQNIATKWHDYHSIPLWGDDYEKLKDEIVEVIINKYKRKRKIDYNKLNHDITKVAYNLWNEKDIDTQNTMFSNFIQEFKENVLWKIKNILI